ncbi:hypothetical protein L0B53_05465 [Vibrio sp. SS-MA-C1-2]|nr:hypothetical protein L0B53_05465 [Vibrio sp. SS-MA-C1-2]
MIALLPFPLFIPPVSEIQPLFFQLFKESVLLGIHSFKGIVILLAVNEGYTCYLQQRDRQESLLLTLIGELQWNYRWYQVKPVFISSLLIIVRVDDNKKPYLIIWQDSCDTASYRHVRLLCRYLS